MLTTNYQTQMNYGAVKDRLPQNINEKLPQEIQDFDAKDAASNSTAAKTITNKDMDPTTIGLTGVLWLGFAQGCQWLNNKLNCDWDNGWLGKIGTKAENFALKHFKNSGNSRIRKFVGDTFDKSAVLRSLKTPTHAENSMAKSTARGITGYVMNDVTSMLGYHLKNGHGDDIVNLVKDIDPTLNITDGKQALDYIEDLFKNCEQNMPKINELIQKMSKSNVDVAVDNLVNTHISIPFSKRAPINFKIPNIPFLKRKGSFKEMGNKLNAVFSNSAGLGTQTTALGKTLPKQALKTLEGLTNGGAGGKIMILMQATIFAQAIKKAMDAPEGEKLSTFSENIANDFGYFLSLPWQVQSSHAIGGLKYIGIGGAKNATEQIANVDTYHNMIKTLNKRVADGTISHAGYLMESKKIKDYLKGNSKWYHKPFKAIGKFFSTGLNAETIKPFVDKADKSLGTAVYNGLRSVVNKIKGPGVGTVLRFAVGTMFVGSFISKITTKISHLIFGRPTKSILDEEDTQKNTEQVQNNGGINMTQEEFAQKLAQNPALLEAMQTNPQFMEQLLNNPQMLEKLLNGEIQLNEVLKNDPSITGSKYIKTPGTNNTQTNPAATAGNVPTPVAQQPTQVQDLNAINPDGSKSQMDLFGLGKEESADKTTAQSDSTEPVRTYIPSSECMIGKTQGENADLNPDINAALLRAEQAEKQALEQLNSL